jgi:hypothetical protein
MVAGGLVAVALVGRAAWDGLWLALVPAAALLILAARELHAACGPAMGAWGRSVRSSSQWVPGCRRGIEEGGG